MSQVVKYVVECWAWGSRVIRQPWRPDWPALILRLEQLAALAGLIAVILTAGGDSLARPAGNYHAPHGSYRLPGSYLATEASPSDTIASVAPVAIKPGAQAFPPSTPNDQHPAEEPGGSATPGAAPPYQAQPATDPQPQQNLQPLRQVAGAGHRVAITFDDGPFPAWTERYLKVLAAMGTRATFFMVGSQAAAHPDLVKAVLAGNNEVASHSWRHANLGKVSREAARDDLNQAATALAGITGQPVKYFRPPYGAMGPNLLAAAGDLHERTVTWSVDPRDWSNPGPSAVIKRVLANVHDGSIILLHEAHPGTLIALPELIKDLRERGYELVTVSELIAAGERK
ncbi:polysaccharide deacetylase family protein [Moorella sp. Hama-1]|uniref:polysaccharide deacetylase family protein n=1 Tax=Moorella sp. Hama-1 TaxID=2138101 RepID=UPI000D654B49|nr:polysaccharide deacetylase family protein [Moorella sp. Hama-1]